MWAKSKPPVIGVFVKGAALKNIFIFIFKGQKENRSLKYYAT